MTNIDPLPLSRLVLNLITVGRAHSLEKVLDTCVENEIQWVSPWQDHYADVGVKHAAKLLRERSVRVSTVCRLTGFGAASTADLWQLAIDDAYRVIEEAAVLGANSVTVIGGGLSSESSDISGARQRIRDGIATVLPAARAAGVTLALEPLHPMVAAERGAINTIAQAVALANDLGDGAGVMIDAYNTWWDPEITASIASATGIIAGYQVADWLVPTTDLAFDRGMPGDGVIDLKHLRSLLESTGYDGLVEIEVLSARWSAMPLDVVIGQVINRSLRNC